MISKERLLLTADGKVVHEGDPRGVRLLVAAGAELSPTDIEIFNVPLKPGGQEIDVESTTAQGLSPSPNPPSLLTVAGAEELPEDFPGRAALAHAGISANDLRGMSAHPEFRDRLIAVKGIAEATADKIIEALPGLTPEAPPTAETSAPTADDAQPNASPTGDTPTTPAKGADEKPGLSIAEATKDIADVLPKGVKGVTGAD